MVSTKAPPAAANPAPPAASAFHAVELPVPELGPTLVIATPRLGPAPVVEPLVPPSPVARPEIDAVLRTLNEYAGALSRMDVSSAARAWPSVDHRALSEAFKTLERNDVALNACAIEVGAGESAIATCRATVHYVPKVGTHTPVLTSQQWRFTLNRVVGNWKIKSATASEER